MSWTKQDLISQALLEIGLSEDFNISPDEEQAALRSLDTMMATWNGRGIRVGYLIESTVEGSDTDDDSGVLDYATEAVYLNLAIRLAPRYGKAVSVETKVAAKQALDSVLTRAVFPTPQPMPNTMPRGAGNRPWLNGRAFYPTPQEPLDAGADDPITF